ncbi:hypothetical protein [Nannocystis sp. SCPEA4]|uniref:hypothetical protein n=1 Tax=Nannocystis sp. SCPEA4 TaxID=2996787 RepID=UPI00226F7A10|nr:hypothetical protein [Nannocystis sp. SCPEA4]MCY1055404.1 hypothetical protein [Nannocystis sp. SCPEA4]
MNRRHRHQQPVQRPPRVHQPSQPSPQREPGSCKPVRPDLVRLDYVFHRSRPAEIRGRIEKVVKDPDSGAVLQVLVLLDKRCSWPGASANNYLHDFAPEFLELDPHPDRW